MYPPPGVFNNQPTPILRAHDGNEGDGDNGDDDPDTNVGAALNAAQLQQKLAAHAINPMTPEELYQIRPPYDVNAWTTAHVERWCIYDVQLPQFAEKCRDKGLDGVGLVGLTDVDLAESLGVDDPLQVPTVLPPAAVTVTSRLPIVVQVGVGPNKHSPI